MSVLGLFIVGALVTSLVGTSVGLLIWGAIMDGRSRPAPVPARRRQRQD